MKNASEAFNEKAVMNGTRYYSKFSIDGVDYPDTINKFQITNKAVGGSILTIGNTCADSISFKLNNPTVELENRLVTFYQGIKINNAIDYIKVGTFLIVKAPVLDEQVSYQGYNLFQYNGDKPYFSELSYPTTDIEILQEAANNLGTSFLLSGDEIAHTINEKPEGYTVREIIGYMAALQGKNAVINADNKVELRWFTDNGYSVDGSKLYQSGVTLKTSKDYILEKIVCNNGNMNEKSEITSGSGTQGIAITNPFMTQTILDEVFAKIGGFTYRPIEAKFLGDFRVDAGDIVTVIKRGKAFKVPVMSITHNSDGGAITKVSALGNSESATTPSDAPLTAKLNRYYAELVLINQAMINKLDAETAKITYATIENLDVVKERVQYLDANFITASDIQATYATIQSLNATQANIDNLSAIAITTENLSTKLADIDTLQADDAFIQNIFSSNILSETLDTRYMSTDFANIDIANINKANVGTLLAEIGLISSAVISEGHVTGFLDSVEVNANNITAGTLTVDRLIISGNEKSIIYAINNAGDLVSQSVDTIDGDTITKRTIAADHLIANTITSNEITTENLAGSNGWYNVHEGTMFLGNANTGRQLSWDGEKLYINSDVIINITDTKYVNMFDDLQKQIDGATDIFFQSDTESAEDIPTLANYPANQWKSSEYANHKNAMYYANDGTVYRFQSEDVMHGIDEVYSGEDKVQTYDWKLMDDNLITKAVALANEAKQEAQTVATDLGVYKEDMIVTLKGYVTNETHTHDLEITQDNLKSYVADNYTTTVDLIGENGILSEYTKTKELASEIKQTSTEIGLAVSEVSETKVNAIKIGAENLLLQSEDLGNAIIYTDVVYDGNEIVYYGTEKVVA